MCPRTRLHPRRAALPAPPLPPTLPSSPTRPNRTRERSTIGAEIYRRQAVRDGPVECAHARLCIRGGPPFLPPRLPPSSPSPLHKPNPASPNPSSRRSAPEGQLGAAAGADGGACAAPLRAPGLSGGPPGGTDQPRAPRRPPRPPEAAAASSRGRPELQAGPGRAPRGRGEPVRRTAAEKARTASPALCDAAVLPRDDEPVHGRGLLPGRDSIFLPLRRRGSAPSGTLRTLAAKRDPRPDGSRQTRG